MVINTVITFPTPPYSNPPIEPQFFQPKQFIVSAITLGPTTIITTILDMDYVIGQQIRLTIPSKYGAQLLNEQIGFVLSIPTSNSVEVDINSNGSDPFIPSPIFIGFESKTPPQIMAIGDVNSGQINTSGRTSNKTFIPGSFVNISPF
jgi:hypothetical protein